MAAETTATNGGWSNCGAIMVRITEAQTSEIIWPGENYRMDVRVLRNKFQH